MIIEAAQFSPGESQGGGCTCEVQVTITKHIDIYMTIEEILRKIGTTMKLMFTTEIIKMSWKDDEERRFGKFNIDRSLLECHIGHK